MTTTSQSGTEPGCKPDTSASPTQGTPRRPDPWPAAMAGRYVPALQPKRLSHSCRASTVSRAVDHRWSTLASRRTWLRKLGGGGSPEHSL